MEAYKKRMLIIKIKHETDNLGKNRMGKIVEQKNVINRQKYRQIQKMREKLREEESSEEPEESEQD